MTKATNSSTGETRTQIPVFQNKTLLQYHYIQTGMSFPKEKDTQISQKVKKKHSFFTTK